jgi:hypothetical protein
MHEDYDDFGSSHRSIKIGSDRRGGMVAEARTRMSIGCHPSGTGECQLSSAVVSLRVVGGQIAETA